MPERAERALRACTELLRRRDVDSVREVLSSLAEIAPPGVEWGVEVVSVAGTRYLVGGGKATVVRVSRDEFGPFMRTQVAEVRPEDLPEEVMRIVLRDPEGFLKSVADQLGAWHSTGHGDKVLRAEVAYFLEGLRSVLSGQRDP